MHVFKRLAVMTGAGVAAAAAIGVTATPAFANIACTGTLPPGGISPVSASGCADAGFYDPNPFGGPGLGAHAAASGSLTIYNGTSKICTGYIGGGVYTFGLVVLPDYQVDTPHAC